MAKTVKTVYPRPVHRYGLIASFLADSEGPVFSSHELTQWENEFSEQLDLEATYTLRIELIPDAANEREPTQDVEDLPKEVGHKQD